jgi:hypothetical protein
MGSHSRARRSMVAFSASIIGTSPKQLRTSTTPYPATVKAHCTDSIAFDKFPDLLRPAEEETRHPLIRGWSSLQPYRRLSSHSLLRGERLLRLRECSPTNLATTLGVSSSSASQEEGQ